MKSLERTQDHATALPGAPFAVAVAGALAALAALAALHALSPEFDPSWRMVSEYATGNHAWLLSAMFLCWALSSWSLALGLLGRAETIGMKVGIAFLALSGLGEAMAAFFDVAHPLHGVAALIGIPSLPVAALLVGFALARGGAGRERATMLAAAHLTWISFLAMTAAMIVFVTTYQQAGGDMSSGVVPATLPEGTMAINGWANRALVIAYCAWLITAARYAKSTPR